MSLMPEAPPPLPALSNRDPHARWKFMRDVAVFEFKLFLNNVHNFFQIPLTLFVAAIDLVLRGQTDGERFYKVVEYGRTIDDAIDIYSIVAHRERKLNADYTVDAVVSRLESVIVREYRKGGTAASVKAAVDRAIDELQARADKGKEKASETIQRAADKMREKMDSEKRE